MMITVDRRNCGLLHVFKSTCRSLTRCVLSAQECAKPRLPQTAKVLSDQDQSKVEPLVPCGMVEAKAAPTGTVFRTEDSSRTDSNGGSPVPLMRLLGEMRVGMLTRTPHRPPDGHRLQAPMLRLSLEQSAVST